MTVKYIYIDYVYEFGAMYIYVDCVYGTIHMYIDCAYGCYVHVY